MSRPLRVHYSNAWYHVMNRGAGRQKIFKNTNHRMMFLELLEESYQMFNVIICAYCLMDNHYHLLLSTPDANLSRIMRHINGVYTQKYNRSLNTDGSLFRGRYKAQLIDDDCYQLIVSRYIHLNPVEANQVRKPADYPWSSYPAYLGLVKTPHWLSTSTIIKQLAETKALSHVKNYQDYVEGNDIEEINVFSSIKNTAPIIGSEAFKEKILLKIDTLTPSACSPDLKRIKTIPEIVFIMNHVSLFYNISHESLVCSKRGTLNWPRLVCMYICRKKYGYTLRAISACFDLLRSETVSSEIGKCHARLLKNPGLYDEIHCLCEIIKESVVKCGVKSS